MSDDSDIIHEFLIEAGELLDQVERDLITLETEPASAELLDRIFRCLHTIKGNTGFLDLPKLESIAHAGETLLNRLRDGQLTLTTDIADVLLRTADAIRTILSRLDAEGQEGDDHLAPLLASLELAGAPPADEKRNAGSFQRAKAPRKPKSKRPPNAATPPAVAVDAIPVPVPSSSAAASIADIDRRESTATDVSLPTNAPGVSRGPTAGDSTIRVQVAHLDALMNLVGELVLVRNMVQEIETSLGHRALSVATQRLNALTAGLQEGVIKTRLQPIGNIWSTFPRVVRDVSKSCGKSVRLEMEGQTTELDKSLLEAMRDPLTHVLRNSIDHGIEAPAERLAKGKPEEGRIHLRSFHEGDRIVIEVIDDGNGVDIDRVKRKAAARGLLTPERFSSMTDAEAMQLLFLPGFSTAEKVTTVSGRGVGMDVVKTNVESIGGAVEIRSRPGQGTTLTFRVPVTVAIIQSLIVVSRGERFAIAQSAIVELVRLEGNEAVNGIERLPGAITYRLRGKLLPLIELNAILGLQSAPSREAPAPQCINIVVVQAENQKFGMIVDNVVDTLEIVVKPLEPQLRAIGAYSGAAILGDGRVALILDMIGIAKIARVIQRTPAGDARPEHKASVETDEEPISLVWIQGPDDGRIAIPLDRVDRLEEIPAQHVERTGAGRSIQYRGRILPLHFLSDLVLERRRRPRSRLSELTNAAGGTLQVVICRAHDRELGLAVERILDIVALPARPLLPAARSGFLGTTVIHDRITEVLDLPALVEATVV